MGRSTQPSLLNDVEWMTGNILDQSFVERALDGVEAVVHLACLPLGQSASDPLNASRMNTEGTLKVLEAVRKTGVQRFVFASTSQVYGGRASLPNREADLPHPDSAYAASKYSAEVWCEAYRRMFALPIVILRLFNVYGLSADGTPRPTVETIFLRQVKEEIQPVITGSPQSGRDFIHIDDVTRAIEMALSGADWEGPLNIGTGVMTTLMELVHLAAKMYGKPLEPTIMETDEPMYCLCADQTLAARLLSFQTKIKLENGLDDIAAAIM